MASTPAVIEPTEDRDATLWSVEVTDGPNKGAVLQMTPGTLTLGSDANNDIVLADAAVAGEQAVLEVAGDAAHIGSLSPGLTVDGNQVAPGKTLSVEDGMVLQTGATIMTVRGPRTPRRRGRWALLLVPLVILAAATAALVGVGSPTRQNQAAAPAPPAMPAPPPSDEALAALQSRLAEVGLANRITLNASPGVVVAQGSLAAADLARWGAQHVWFDERYKGKLSLLDNVVASAEAERPNIKVSAVAGGAIPYIITSTGDRFVEGAVVNGWTVETITPEKVIFSKNGTSFEMDL